MKRNNLYKRRNVAWICFGAVIIFLLISFGPSIVASLSPRGNLIRIPSMLGAITLIVFSLLYLLSKKRLGINQGGVFLALDMIKAMIISLCIYFVVAWIWSLKGQIRWTESGYIMVCFLFGFFGSIFTIGIVINQSPKNKTSKDSHC